MAGAAALGAGAAAGPCWLCAVADRWTAPSTMAAASLGELLATGAATSATGRLRPAGAAAAAAPAPPSNRGGGSCPAAAAGGAPPAAARGWLLLGASPWAGGWLRLLVLGAGVG
jgi:hypothetical protein